MNLPLYKDIASQLTQKIDKGEYAVGTYLPTELEISEEYKVSRATVRAAIAILEQQGLISRKKKAGTRVEMTSVQQSYQYDLNTITDLIYLGEQHVRQVLAVQEIVVDIKLGQQYNLPAGEHFVSIQSIRLNGKPNHTNNIFSFTQLYFPVAYKEVITQIHNQPSKLIALLIEEFTGKGISYIEQSIQCIELTPDIKAILGIQKAKSPVRLCIYRKYFSQDKELLLASSSIHQDENFTYNFNLYRK